MPDVVTLIDCVVALFDHTLFVGEDETNVTEPPEQKVVEPDGVIIGTAGVGLTVTEIVADVGD